MKQPEVSCKAVTVGSISGCKNLYFVTAVHEIKYITLLDSVCYFSSDVGSRIRYTLQVLLA